MIRRVIKPEFLKMVFLAMKLAAVPAEAPMMLLSLLESIFLIPLETIMSGSRSVLISSMSFRISDSRSAFLIRNAFCSAFSSASVLIFLMYIDFSQQRICNGQLDPFFPVDVYQHCHKQIKSGNTEKTYGRTLKIFPDHPGSANAGKKQDKY